MSLSSNEERLLLPPLFAALLLAAGPQFLHQPLWLSALVLAAWLLRLAMAFKNLPLPGKKTRIFFTWIGFFIILAGSSGSFAQDAGSRLLLMMAALKPFETRTRRDAVILVFIAHLLLLSSLLFSESLAMALYMLLPLILNHGVLALIHTPETGLKPHILQSIRLFFLAAPLALIIFLVFPRLSSPLWGIQRTTPEGISGISDRLQPGSMASLATDNTPAFRVHFEGPIPPASQRYFRGLVFNKATPGLWLPDTDAKPLTLPENPAPVFSRYTLILEPHQQKWAFALDWPTGESQGFYLAEGGLLRSRENIKRRVAYTLEASEKSLHLDPGTKEDLLLPPEENPKALALGQSIRERHAEPKARLEAIRSWFLSEPFRYTLNPGLLPQKNAMDAFLFETKRGYCEHFALGFALLARAAGLKSRVVGGYLGGDINPLGPYLVLRQSDAHAWTEVFLPDTGWQRVDATAWIAPERLSEGGTRAALPEEDRRILERAGGETWLRQHAKPLLQLWDSATHLWHRQVLGYTHTRQQEILKRAGSFLKSIQAFFFLGGAGALVFLFLFLKKHLPPFMGTRPKEDILLRAWILLGKKMEKAGVRRLAHEGPLDYEKKIAEQRPDLAAGIRPLIAEYVRLRYGPEKTDGKATQNLLRAVRRLKISERISG